jgi:tRNA A-37 threonylcarbamoyl transferase component Bud32
MPERLTRQNLESFVERVLWKGHASRADVKLIRLDGALYVVKDFAGKPWYTTALLGPWLLGRECRIYRALTGIEGVPKLIRRIDSLAYVLEYVEGIPLKEHRWAGRLPDELFHSIERTVHELHRRGVVHFDLRQRRNYMISDDALRAYLLDFGTSVYFGKSGVARDILVPMFKGSDLGGLLKIKWRLWPHLLTEKDKRQINRSNFWRKFWIFTPTREDEWHTAPK